MNRRETLCDYFDEDVVIKRSSNGKVVFGLVIESSENASDSEESSDSDEDSDDDHNNPSVDNKWHHLKPGFTKIALYPNGNTLVINESKVKLYDRSLLSGDVVQRLDPISHKLVPNSEHGFCKSTKIIATLKLLGTDKVIENVDSNELQMLSHISEDTICLLDSWLGYVKDVNQKITLKCSDGSLLTVSDIDLSEFEDLLTQRENNDSEFNRDDFYIGQQLYGPKKDLKHSKWTKQTDLMKHFMKSNSCRNSKINVVVEGVSIDSVSINWLCCLSDESLSKNVSQNCETINNSLKNTIKNKSNNSSLNVMSHPNGTVIRGEAIQRIKCLNYFAKSSLQIGHQCYYTIKPTDSVIKFSEWETKESLKLSEDISPEEEFEPKHDNESSAETTENLAKKRSISESLSLSSIETNDSKTKKKLKKTKTHFSLSLKKVRNKKLFASQRKSPYLLPINTSAGSRLPVEIMATNTRVTVVWQSSVVETDIPSTALYPVHHIDNHDFFAGDFVVENKDISESFDYGVVQKCHSISRTATVKWFSMTAESQSAQFVAQQEVSVYDIKDHPDFNFRSGVCVVRILTDEDDSHPTSRAGQVTDLTLDGMLECVWLNGQTSMVYPQQLIVVGDYDSDDLWEESDSEFDYSDYSYNDSNCESWETDDECTPANDNSKKTQKTSPKKSANISNNQSLISLLHSGATQLEGWLTDGTGKYRNSIKNLVKLMKRAETSTKESDSSQKLSSNYTNKMQQLSKRLLQLLPFSQTPQPIATNNNNSNHINGIETNESQNTSEESATSSQTNVNSFLELIDDLKIEILKNETQNQSINGENVENLDNKSNDNSLKSDIIETKDSSHSNSSSELVAINECLSGTKGNVIFLDSVPECHKYFNSSNEPKNPKEFLKRIKHEITLLKSALPEGIDVTLFHNRIDLLSVLVIGPKGTPYEDGLFLFDIQLPPTYPWVPPKVHFLSFCSDRLNPNLYESGKVCISLLGTWSGKGTEVWAPNSSNLLQLIISIQGLILVSEPYYNEAGYIKQRGTSIANENSRLYNEMVVIKMIQSMSKMLSTPPKTFDKQIREYIIGIANKMIERHENWEKVSQICIINLITSAEQLYKSKQLIGELPLPPFPLLPASHGFCLSLNKAIQTFKQTLNSFDK